MQPPKLVLLAVTATEVEAGDVGSVVRVLDDLASVPAVAKEHRGKILLDFASYEEDPRPNWQIPGIRQFMQRLDRAVPSLPYFVCPDPRLEYLTFYLLSLVERTAEGGVQSEALWKLVQTFAQRIRDFCREVADNADAAIAEIYLGLPDEMLRADDARRRLVLERMVPLVEAALASPGNHTEAMSGWLARAERLAGTTVAEAGSPNEFLARIREFIKGAPRADPKEVTSRVDELVSAFATSVEFAHVLIVFTSDGDQLNVAATLKKTGWVIVSSNGDTPSAAFLETLDQAAKVALLFRGSVPDDLYMLARDYVLDRELPLKSRFGSHSIHPDHRLTILVEPEAWKELGADLRRLVCTVGDTFAFSGDFAAEPAEPHVFRSVTEAVAWCERYYGGGRFLFRGQVRDWPPLAPICRATSQSQLDAWNSNREMVVRWLCESEVALSPEDALVVAQHHGLKTSLLDLTRSIPVAAFFATHGAKAGSGEPGVLYVFHEADLHRTVTETLEALQGHGRGVLEPRIEPLRRIRHQQGLFLEASQWLIKDAMLAKLFFKHDPVGRPLPERIALPRDFIYPPPSNLERKTEAFILVAEVGAGDEYDPLNLRPPRWSFDSGGYVIREYLDVLRPGKGPLKSPHAILDGYAGVLAMDCAHLFVHQNEYQTVVVSAAQQLSKGAATPAVMDAARRLKALQSYIMRPVETGVPASPELSTRDLVDGLAVYHSIRSANSKAEPERIQESFKKADYERLWNAYLCAEYWLGKAAWDVYPAVAAFALGCRHPVLAFIESARAVGFHDPAEFVQLDPGDAVRLLATWTGHDLVAIEEAMPQKTTTLLKRRLDRRAVASDPKDKSVSHLARFLHLHDDATFVRLVPQFTWREGGQLTGGYDPELGSVLPVVEMTRGILEGLAGLESTMLCPHGGCEYHAFRICGRTAVVPARVEECRFRVACHKIGVTPQTLNAWLGLQSAGS